MTKAVSWSTVDCKCPDCLPACVGKCECLETIEFEKEFDAQ